MIHTETGIPGSQPRGGGARMLAARIRRAALAGVTAAAVALLNGCVTQPDGGMLMGIDTAGLFGDTIARFPLQDGGEGTLRRDKNGVYTVKLGSHLLQLEKVNTARLARVENVGPRTVVLLETELPDCHYKYALIAVQGKDLQQWGLGNCSDRPRVALASQGRALTIDFPKRHRLQRITYNDNRVISKSIPAPDGVNPALRPFANASLRADAGATLPPPDPALAADPPDEPAEAPGPVEVAGVPAPASDNPGPAAPLAPPPPVQKAGGASPAVRRKPVAITPSTRPPASMIFPPQEIPTTHLDLRN